MRFNEFVSAEDKLALLRLIDDAIWQTFDRQNVMDNEPNADDRGNDSESVGQGMDTPVAAAPRLATTPPVQAYQPAAKTTQPKRSKMPKPVAVPKPTPIQRNPNPKPSKIHVNDSKLNQNRSFGMPNAQNTSAVDNWQGDSRQA